MYMAINKLLYLLVIFLVAPVECQDICMCNYVQEHQANSMVCNYKLPSTILNKTNWLTVSQGNIGLLCGNYSYLNQIWNLNLSCSGITTICESFIIQLTAANIYWLDLSGNTLSGTSPQIKHGHFKKIWLSGNKFDCNCDTLWMASWLANTTTSTGDHLVMDYKDVLCGRGKYMGTPIYTLNATYLNCLPTKLPVWGIGLITGAGVLIIAIVIAMLAIARRWNEVKFMAYLHFNILNKNDDDVDALEGIQFDALLSYS